MNNPMFPQMYPQYPQMNLNTMPAQSHNGINWVQGIEGARAFQQAPNSNDILLDSENDGIFYIKVADNVGMCKLRTFKYEEITDAPTSGVDLTGYVKKEELASLVKNIMKENRNDKSVSTTKPTRLIAE